MHEGRKEVKVLKVPEGDDFVLGLPRYFVRDLHNRGVEYVRFTVKGAVITIEPMNPGFLAPSH